MRQLKVFLCYAKEDKSVVQGLYNRLIQYPWLDVWIDDNRLLPGHNWRMNIEVAVESSDVVIVCLSNQSVDKEGYIQKELRLVLNTADEKPEGAIFVIPLRLDDCQVPRRLQDWQYVDYFPIDHENIVFDRVVESLKYQSKRILDISNVQDFDPIPSHQQSDLSETLDHLISGKSPLSQVLNMINVRFEDSDKNIIYQKHWLVLANLVAIPSIILWVMLILLINGITRLLFFPTTQNSWLGVLAWVGIAYPIYTWWMFQYYVWKNDIYKITSEKVLSVSRVSFGAEHSIVAYLENITEVQYEHKGTIGHKINLGTVYVVVGSEKMILTDVYNPSRIKYDIERYMELRNNEKPKGL